MKWLLFDRLWPIMQISKLWNSHAGLAPQASNIPNKIQVLNWGLIWSLHYSSDKQIIEMITEIKFAIINILIHSWEERLTCFDCKKPFVLLNDVVTKVWHLPLVVWTDASFIIHITTLISFCYFINASQQGPEWAEFEFILLWNQCDTRLINFFWSSQSC